jgi:hypothetical protein
MKEFNSPKDNFLTGADSITNLINVLDKDDLYRNYDEITKENADIVYAFEKSLILDADIREEGLTKETAVNLLHTFNQEMECVGISLKDMGYNMEDDEATFESAVAMAAPSEGAWDRFIKFIVEKFNSVLAFFKRLLGLSDVELTTYDNEAAKLETAISNKSDAVVEVPKEKNTPETAVTTRVKEVDATGKTLEKAKLFLSDLGNASKTGLFSDKKHLEEISLESHDYNVIVLLQNNNLNHLKFAINSVKSETADEKTAAGEYIKKLNTRVKEVKNKSKFLNDSASGFSPTNKGMSSIKSVEAIRSAALAHSSANKILFMVLQEEALPANITSDKTQAITSMEAKFNGNLNGSDKIDILRRSEIAIHIKSIRKSIKEIKSSIKEFGDLTKSLSDVKSELSSGGKPVKLGVLQKYIGKQATYCNLLINANTGIINLQKEALRVLAVHSSMYKNK